MAVGRCRNGAPHPIGTRGAGIFGPENVLGNESSYSVQQCTTDLVGVGCQQQQKQAVSQSVSQSLQWLVGWRRQCLQISVPAALAPGAASTSGPVQSSPAQSESVPYSPKKKKIIKIKK